MQANEEVIGVIKNRSEGLLMFAQIYRKLSKITELNCTKVYVEQLFQSVSALIKPLLEKENIRLQIFFGNKDLTLQADPHLLEQVLINQVLNAERVVKEKTDGYIYLI